MGQCLVRRSLPAAARAQGRRALASAAKAFIAGRRLGEGTAAGPKNFVVDRVGELVRAGADEIVFGGIITDDVAQYQRVAEEVIPAFA